MGFLSRYQKNRGSFSPRSFLVFLLLAITCLSAIHWNFLISDKITVIQNAPIDPSGPSSFAFFNFAPDPALLVDPVLNISCSGHELSREVHQYIQVEKNSPAIGVLVLNDQEISSGQFPLSTRFFEAQWLSNGRYSVHKSNLASNLSQSKPYLLSESPSAPGRWKKLSRSHFFWGADPNKPQANNIDVAYTCSVIPDLSLWGSVDEQGVIIPDRWLSGFNTLNASEQKNRMVYSLETFKLSSIIIHSFIINALFLIFVKEQFMRGYAQSVSRIVLRLRQYDILLTPLILLIPPSFITALIFSIFLTSYAALYSFARKQSQELLDIQRINFYR